MNIKKAAAALLGICLFTGAGCSSSASKKSSSASSSSSSTAAAGDPVKTVDLDDEDTEESYDKDSAVTIKLSGTSAECSDSAVSIASGKVTIAQPGTYVLTGTFHGQIIIDSESKGTVRLVLNGVNITYDGEGAISAEAATKTILTAYKDTENAVSDTSEETDSKTNAAIYSKDDLVINGSGSLTVSGNANDGITSKDSLYIINTKLTVTASDDGIIGKDMLYMQDVSASVTGGGDALKASNTADIAEGNVLINGGTYTLTAGDDGIQAVNGAVVMDGTISLKAGEGASAAVHTEQEGGGFAPQGSGTDDNETETDTADEEKCKGITAEGTVDIEGGTITMDTQDDSLHAAGDIEIAGGTLQISAGDDAMHADDTLTIDGGTVNVTESYEGLEGLNVVINAGNISVVSSDDGVNSSDPSVSSDTMTADSSAFTMNGGTLTVNAEGDGIDMNGSGTMTGGTVTVYGPENSGNGALDYAGSFEVNGGTLLAGGSTGMAQTPSEDSSLYTLSIGTSGGSITVKDSSGNEIASYSSAKSYGSLILTSESVKSGETYTVYEDGTETGSVTVSDKISSINASSNGGMNGGGRGQNGAGGKSGV